MTNRRPQDPQTKRLHDEREDIPTVRPQDSSDPGATILPDDFAAGPGDPRASDLPEAFVAPKPRAERGGGVVRGGSAAERTMTAEGFAALRAEVQVKAAGEVEASARPKKRRAGWGVWLIAFLLLGGLGFGVAWFVMNPPGGDGGAASMEAVSDASPSEAADGTSEGRAEVADGTSEGRAEVADGTSEGRAAEVAPAADGGAAAGETTATDAGPAVAVVDAQALEVVALPKPLIANPIEATRLNEDGLAMRKAGDHAAALRLYEQALAADPDHVWARYNYACELALAKRGKDALTELTRLYKVGTPDARRALQAARKDPDFASIKDTGQFFRLTNF